MTNAPLPLTWPSMKEHGFWARGRCRLGLFHVVLIIPDCWWWSVNGCGSAWMLPYSLILKAKPTLFRSRSKSSIRRRFLWSSDDTYPMDGKLIMNIISLADSGLISSLVQVRRLDLRRIVVDLCFVLITSFFLPDDEFFFFSFWWIYLVSLLTRH